MVVRKNEDCKCELRGTRKHYHCTECEYITHRRDNLVSHAKVHTKKLKDAQTRLESRLGLMRRKGQTRLLPRTQVTFMDINILTFPDIYIYFISVCRTPLRTCRLTCSLVSSQVYNLQLEYAYYFYYYLPSISYPQYLVADISRMEDELVTAQLSQVASDDTIAAVDRMNARLLMGSIGPISRTAQAAVNDIGRMPVARSLVLTEQQGDFEVQFYMLITHQDLY